VGSSTNDLVGSGNFFNGNGGVTALANGDYVVDSSKWSSYKGAVTWGNGMTGITGTVSSANSLIGSTNGTLTTGDRIGLAGVIALTNGNYVIDSYGWSGGAGNGKGAVTWGNGGTGITGVVSSSNSLIGSSTADSVGANGVYALTNGNYAVTSQYWSGGSTNGMGAVTWGNGYTGTAGIVSSANSLIGTHTGDLLGSGSFVTTADGGFVVGSPSYNSGVGRVELYVPGHFSPSPPQLYSDTPGSDITISTAAITAITNTGTSVTLQANNDITLSASSDIITSGTAGGNITLDAGRSILLNSNITTANGNLTLLANDTAADGVVDADRAAGAAVISMASGTTINTGTGSFSATISTGAGNTNHTSGDITLYGITAGSIFAQNAGSGNIVLDGALTASGTGTAITLVSGHDFINTDGASAFSTPSGHWLVYSTDPSDNTLGGLGSDFNRYTCTYGGSCPSFPSTGNGFLYRYTPMLTVTPDAASITYGDAAPGFSYALSGYLGSDAASDGVTGTVT